MGSIEAVQTRRHMSVWVALAWK